VVTNSIMAASELMETNHRLILLGGEFRARSRTLVGPLTSRILESLAINTAFLGTMGFTVESGISTSDPNEAYTKELVMKRAAQVILLADSSKLGTPSLAGSGSTDDIDLIITDKNVQTDLVGRLAKKHIQVICTGNKPEDI
jgi:DeoR/GlpR family transcriptional regulator of sugar metabolism